jgi:hypothetical protein
LLSTYASVPRVSEQGTQEVASSIEQQRALSKVPLTVVMPAYNEDTVIEDAVREVQKHVLDAIPGAELVVVDDGSRDRTGTILDELALGDARTRVIHQPNRGHGSALRVGLEAARGECLFLLDSDRQIPLDAFADLWRVARARAGLFGVRVKRQDPRLRLWLSAFVRVILRLLFRVRLRDANAPFKVVQKSVWTQASPLIPPDTLTPSLFLAVYACRSGLDVIECGVPHRPRFAGASSIRGWRLLKLCARALGQLLAFRWRLP